MPRQRNMIAALLLLCAIELHCSDGAAAQNQACIRTHEVACFVPPDNLNASEPVSIKVSAGMKLNISLGHLSGYSACQWMRGVDLIQTVNEIHSMVTPRPFSVNESGEYTLSCKTSNITSSMTVSLHVMKRPTKPRLTLERTDKPNSSPLFKCISEGYPTPKLEWSGSGNKKAKNLPANNGNACSEVSTSRYHNSGAMCCATNDEGQECSQLYDYDLETDVRRNEEVSNVTVSAGQPLLLRCRIKGTSVDQCCRPVWEKGSEIMDSETLICSSEANEICIKNDLHYDSVMAYLFIKSVGVDHSGTYTCRSPKNKTKSVYIHVRAEGFISATLDETKILPVQDASSSCLQANVSYEPVLEHCFWEDPDKTITKCRRDNWVSKHSTLKLCQPLKSGDYKLHLEAGGRKETKTISVCVAGALGHDNNSVMLMKLVSLILLLALVAVCVALVYFVKKKKPQYQPQLQMIQMVGPNDNDYIYINFKDFEYDQKWEFPRENLELGTELGSGAFGMVVQATAYGINKPGVSQQVAVKMLKEKHQMVEKEALMSELKMLTYIGHHANIVNLLGACTDSGPIYLIFQYCCYGDLLNYLKKNRERYHKSATDAFDKDRFSSLYHNLQLKKSTCEINTAVENYVPMHSSTTRGQKDIALLHLNSGDTNSLEDPEIYENLDDQTEDLQVLTFDDLLSFAFQVAKGMEFLSSKNCIHRDLAARNVLVTKGRLIKIGDFGLARDIDNDSNYVVRGNVRHIMSFYTMKEEEKMLSSGYSSSLLTYYFVVCQLYHNMPDQTSSEYKNTPAVIDISALTKQSESKTQVTNDYYRTSATEESRTEMSDTEAAEEKLLKPPDTE
ncbi:Receptor-type tyrosine-protein kinase FLT3 [Collichthys lucidus]|uniref:receptor protein-tyrosine kinase n=1 Tax=Collichthys lucidus TaxID=240159 RepID=A0A4U5VI26_COLLU|nr:Receptor-type tyrosine-protein kinase FLT3 [Collichthys lucidus]